MMNNDDDGDRDPRGADGAIEDNNTAPIGEPPALRHKTLQKPKRADVARVRAAVSLLVCGADDSETAALRRRVGRANPGSVSNANTRCAETL
jgi:hypothetical protein